MLICISGCATVGSFGAAADAPVIADQTFKRIEFSLFQFTRWSTSGRHTISSKTPSSFGAWRRWSSAASSSCIVKCFTVDSMGKFGNALI